MDDEVQEAEVCYGRAVMSEAEEIVQLIVTDFFAMEPINLSLVKQGLKKVSQKHS